MKKLYMLILLCVFAISMANTQDPAPLIFSEYIEGSSNNKALEIYNPNDVPVDLASYQIVQSSNGNGWEYYHIFPGGAAIQPKDVWVIITDQTDGALFDPSGADEVLGYPSVAHHNGDDARGIIYISDTDTTLLDVLGIPDEDPGSGWDVAGVETATANHTLVRKNHILEGNTDWEVSAGTDQYNSEWIVYDQNFFDSLGIHTYAPFIEVTNINLTGEGGVAEITVDKGTLQINAEILPANANDVRIVWSVNDVVLASISQDGLLTAINDGVVTVTATALDGSGVTGTIDITNTNQVPVVPVSSIIVTGDGGVTTISENGGSLQLLAEVLPADASDPTITWSVDDTIIGTVDQTGLLTAINSGTVLVTATANDGFGGVGRLEVVISNQFTEVADLSELKTMDVNDESTVYKITGEVVLTFQQSYRNKKYVQDAGAGVGIDDNPGNITTVYDVGDGITGLMGTIEEYNGFLQFHPVADPGAASSSGNLITPIVVTPAELNANHDTYESMVVMAESVTFNDADGTTVFENGSNYDFTDGADTAVCRVDFYGTTLTGTVIPDSAHITGIVLEYNGTAQVSPRHSEDVEELVAFVPSSDASISDLLVDSVSVAGFTPAQITYNVELEAGTAVVPVVTVVTNDENAVVTVTDATDLGGTEAERTTTVLITAEDGVTTKTYQVIFTVAVGIADQTSVAIEIYPVPARNILHLQNVESIHELRIVSITGSVIDIYKLSGENSTELHISHLESGLYFLKMSGDTSTQIIRFIKE